jgi:hypothetical protein
MLIMRLLGFMLSFPHVLLLYAIMAVLGRSLTKAMVSVGAASIRGYAGLMQGEALVARESDYATAMLVLGASRRCTWQGSMAEVLDCVEEDLAIVTLTNVNSIKPAHVIRGLIERLFADRLSKSPPLASKEVAWHATVEAGLWIEPETPDVTEL